MDQRSVFGTDLNLGKELKLLDYRYNTAKRNCDRVIRCDVEDCIVEKTS